jgi:hypothetical protein
LQTKHRFVAHHACINPSKISNYRDFPIPFNIKSERGMLLVRKKGHQPEGKTGLTKRCEKNEVQPHAVAATRSVASRK